MGVNQIIYIDTIPFIPGERQGVPWYLDFPFWEWCFMAVMVIQLAFLMKFQKSFYLANAASESMITVLEELIEAHDFEGLEKI